MPRENFTVDFIGVTIPSKTGIHNLTVRASGSLLGNKPTKKCVLTEKKYAR
jgi:hypothetical protein